MALNRKIDMDHGFMQSIIKNQVNRDNYDKEVKARSPKNHQSSSKKKPDLVTYIPPKKARDPLSKTLLFVFEYEDPQGNIHSLDIHKEDDITWLVRQLGKAHSFTDTMTQVLTDHLKAEARAISKPD